MQHLCASHGTDKPWTKRPSKSPKNFGEHDQFAEKPAAPDHVQNHVVAQENCSTQFRTSDEYYNVPSRWFAQDNQNQDQQEDELPEDAEHFLHEDPDSLQSLYDALFHKVSLSALGFTIVSASVPGTFITFTHTNASSTGFWRQTDTGAIGAMK